MRAPIQLTPAQKTRAEAAGNRAFTAVLDNPPDTHGSSLPTYRQLEHSGWKFVPAAVTAGGVSERLSLQLDEWTELRAIRSVDSGRWHLSVSVGEPGRDPDRYPTWDEIRIARDALLPRDAWLCVPFPPRQHWHNLHPFVFHLYEVDDPQLAALWAGEGAVAREVGAQAPTDETGSRA